MNFDSNLNEQNPSASDWKFRMAAFPNRSVSVTSISVPGVYTSEREKGRILKRHCMSDRVTLLSF